MKPLLAFVAASLILITLTGVAVRRIGTPKPTPVTTPAPDDADIKLNRPKYEASDWSKANSNHELRALHQTSRQAKRIDTESGTQTLTYKTTYHNYETGQRVFVYLD